MIAYAATYTWKADENGNWDGNITDPAHWECDTAGSPEYPQSSSDNVKIPQNITAKITIDKSVDTIFGKWELSDKCHVAFTSLMLDNNEMANLKMQSLNVKYGATLILDRGRITHEANDNVSFKRGAKVIVQNGSSLTVKNSYMQEQPNYGYSSIYVEVSGKSMATFTTITIGGGAKFVIDDSTVIVRNRLALQTDQNGKHTSDATTMLFKGKGARLLFYEKDSFNAKSLQACMFAKIDGDVLNFDYKGRTSIYPRAYPACIYSGKDNVYKFASLQLSPEKSTNILVGYPNMSWNGLYKGSIVRDNKLRFRSEREYVSEDVLFHFENLIYFNRIGWIDRPLVYHYILILSRLLIMFSDIRFS
jgi:hypothetical protein